MAGITDWIIDRRFGKYFLRNVLTNIQQGLNILLSDSELSEEFSAEQSPHGRRSVAGHSPAQLLSSQLLKCPPVLSEICMATLENGNLMGLVCIYLSNAVRSILSWPRDTRVRNRVSL